MIDLRAWNRRRNNWLREQKGKWISPFLGRLPACPPYDSAHIHKVLVLRNDNKLGDAVVGSALFRGLRQLFPKATIDVVACKNTAAVFRANGFVDRIWCASEGIVSLLICGLKLRRQHYDLYIDVDEKPMLSSLVFLKCLQPKYALGLNREKFPLYNINLPLAVENIHITQRYEALLRKVGLKGKFDNSYHLALPAQVLKQAAAWVHQTLRGQDFWVFNPLASNASKSFTAQQILPLCNLFPTQHIVLVGKADDLKKWLYPHPLPKNVVLYSGSVLQAVAVATHANLLFTPDTFWVHAACALHIPTLCVYNGSALPDGNYTGETAMWRPLVSQVQMRTYPAAQNTIPAQWFIEVFKAYLKV